MINQIKDYFTFDRSYEQGLALVMKFTAKMALKKQLNVQPKSDYLLGVIHEELRQLCELSHKEFEQIILQPVLEKPVLQEPAPEPESITAPEPESNTEPLPEPENPDKPKKAHRRK